LPDLVVSIRNLTDRMAGGSLKTIRVFLLGLVEPILYALLLFVPAWTLNYWQAWVFLLVYFPLFIWIPHIYLMRKNPAALQRRMVAGPVAEKRMTQKVVIAIGLFLRAATLAVSSLDHRFGWSTVPTAICWLGIVLVAIGLGVMMLVVFENSYAAATIRVEGGQELISTGLYGLVRHPMYSGGVILIVGIPLALGSYWGLVFVIPGLILLALRILDEEKLLRAQLDGYREYTEKVRYRLVPSVW
jgi:protein-S-isoprenylcysteine O-methyltransferase Ste14